MIETIRVMIWPMTIAFIALTLASVITNIKIHIHLQIHYKEVDK